MIGLTIAACVASFMAGGSAVLCVMAERHGIGDLPTAIGFTGIFSFCAMVFGYFAVTL